MLMMNGDDNMKMNFLVVLLEQCTTKILTMKVYVCCGGYKTRPGRVGISSTS